MTKLFLVWAGILAFNVACAAANYATGKVIWFGVAMLTCGYSLGYGVHIALHLWRERKRMDYELAVLMRQQQQRPLFEEGMLGGKDRAN